MKLTARQLISELRERKTSCGVHGLTFAPGALTEKQKREVEAYLQENFARWWDSWLAPLIDETEKRLVKPRRKKT